MKPATLAVSIFAVALFWFPSASAFAQHDTHHPDANAPQAQTAPQTATGGMMANNAMKDMKPGDAKAADAQGDMKNMKDMKSGEMGMMAKMKDREKQTSDLIAKLAASMDAIDNEKNPTALKQKLADHRTLLEQLQKQDSEPKCDMMKNMSGMPAKDAQSPAN
jgi:hypothetical protein